MTKKRNRTRPALSLQERLNKFTQDARAAARNLPAGAERHALMQKVRDGEAAADMERLLSSPGPAHPEMIVGDAATQLVLDHQRERGRKALLECQSPGLVDCGEGRRDTD